MTIDVLFAAAMLEVAEKIIVDRANDSERRIGTEFAANPETANPAQRDDDPPVVEFLERRQPARATDRLQTEVLALRTFLGLAATCGLDDTDDTIVSKCPINHREITRLENVER